MSQNYLPLFRKYRPQSFKDIVGQESLVKALSNAITLGRIANAYLFCGPRGTGKTSTARILAKSLNCVNGPTLEPCQKCASCVDITNARGLDVIEIDAASNRGIQDAKDLIAQAQYAPINGKYKIFIIDEVHMLSNDAFNALLKTFEEPPEHVIFILATTEPHKVLETIVSRCQRFDLRRITTDDIVKRLREISDLEKIKITDGALYTIAKNVSGGLRDSLALLDQVSILGISEEITKDTIEELLGKINFDTLLELLKLINEENIEKTLLKIDEIYSKGNEPRNLAENFIEFLRNIILILNSDDNESIINFTNLIAADIEAVRACNFDKDKILNILNILIEHYKEIKTSTNPYLWMEIAGISMCKPCVSAASASIQVAQSTKNVQSTQLPKAKIEIPKPQVEQPKPQVEQPQQEIRKEIPLEAKTNEPTAQVVSQTTAINSDEPAAIWSSVITNIKSLPARAFWSSVAKVVKIEDKKVTLGFINDNVLAQAKSESKISHLKTAMNTICADWSAEFIRITSDTKTLEIKQPKKQAPQAVPQVQTREVVSEPISKNSSETLSEDGNQEKQDTRRYSPQVREMIEQFNGRIIE